MVERVEEDMEWEGTYQDGEGGWDDEDDWGENADEEGQVYVAEPVEMDPQFFDDKGFKVVKSQEVSKQVLAKIDDLKDLYEIDLDALILIARHYSWNQDRMQDWFVE